MSSGATPPGSQPHPNPPADSGFSPTPPDDAVKPSLDGKVDSLKKAAVSILEGTEWPPDSTDHAKTLINAISTSPNIATNNSHATKELQNLIEKYIEILDDIHIRLKDASSKAAMKRWKFLQMIKSMTSDRPSKCALLFKTCQDDLLKAMKTLNERLEYERAKDNGSAGGPESLGNVKLHSTGQGGADSLVQGLATSTAEQGSTSDDSTPNPPIPTSSQLNAPQKLKDRGLISDEALSIARKTFKSVEIASGAIPVVGTYIGAAAKVGLAFVETLETMDRNNSLATDLGEHTSKLNKLIEKFKERSSIEGKEMADQIDALHMELVLVNDKVEEWSRLGRFNKAFLARDHGETLKDYQGRIKTAQEEMQLLVSVDSRSIIIDLELRRLLKCLGDGQFGSRGSVIEDIICFPGTRMEVLERIDEWIRDNSSPSPVFWISGMAGRGKSTIASTVVHNWKGRASCAIFHFRRGQVSLNSRVICALARQLGSSLVSEVKEAVIESVRKNEEVADPGRRLDEQFKTFLVSPFATLKSQLRPILIVIDALDECDNPQDAVNLVRLIHKHSPSFPTTVKFLLTSRPEGDILRHLKLGQWRKEDLELASDINDDIGRFLDANFTRIRLEHDLSENWPSPGDIKQLVRMSQGLFQWARTAISYLDQGSPVGRLRVLLNRPSAWSGLDDLYHQILSKAFGNVRLDPVRQDLLTRVLGALVVAPHPISLEIIAFLYGKHDTFDGINAEDVIPFLQKDVLADLSSLLFIPALPAESMRLMHTSIPDLLTSKVRCKDQPFYVDRVLFHHQLANLCLETMLGRLKENICDLSDVSCPVSEIQDIVERKISKGLQYCCRAWPTHLTEGVTGPKQSERATTGTVARLESFSKEKVMYWLEVMSLVGATRDAILAGTDVYGWLLELQTELPEHNALSTLWEDVQRFITTFLEPISFGPLHIYISALPHCPVNTEVWKFYGKNAKVHLLQGDRMSTWPSNLWARSANTAVNSVAFSPDGRVLALGLIDGTVRLWDAQSGVAVGEPLIGHSDQVWSVCFSPDHKLLASGSMDGTIRLWDPETRIAVGEPLIGHSSHVYSVCFRGDSKVLASGSEDRTVRLWDTSTGAEMGQALTGHSYAVRSVCFSPDGSLLASGSADETIRLWYPLTGAAVGEPFAGHSGPVRSVCFLSNGNLLASGSDDGTVRIWDIKTRTSVHGPLTGHNDEVWSVCSSSEGDLLASGSVDWTIRLWNVQTGAAVGEPLIGHGGWTWSLSFSPDGKLLASGSNDETVRLWDPQAGVLARAHNRHTYAVTSVAFSPDGKRVASGSFDHSLRLWDPQTAAAVGEPLTGHSREVTSVCFSPDGKLLASGSWDCTIRLWDAQTQIAVGEPLKGHGDWVRSVCFSPDGKYLASGSDDLTVRLWDPMTGVQVGEALRGHSALVMSVCFSPDGKYLASGSSDKTIRLWDPQTRVAVGEPLEGHSDFVIFISFSSDGTLLIARYHNGSTATWDVATRQRCDTSRGYSLYTTPLFQEHWITFGSSRFIWLPPQYWNSKIDAVSLFDGHLAAFQNESLSILDVSQILGTLTD